MDFKPYGTLDGLRSLIPGVQAIITDDDFSTLTYLVPVDNPPSEAEVRAETQRLNEAYQADLQNRAAQKVALLERLGITEEEAQLLLS